MNKTDKQTLTNALNNIKSISIIIEAQKEIARQRELIQQIIKDLEKHCEDIEPIADKEREKYDEKSDRWKETYRGEQQEKLADNLERAHSDISSVIYDLENCMGDDY